MSEVVGKIKKKRKTSPLKIFIFIFSTIWCITFYFCLIWLVYSSFKSRVEYLTDPVGLPTKWHFSNYIDAFTQLSASGKNLIVMFFNTCWLTFGTIFLQMLFSLMFAYAIARFKFPGRDLIYWVVIAQMMITVVGSLPATYTLLKRLNMYDTPLYLITNLSGTSGFLVFYATFKGIPQSFAEAAHIDGAGHVKVFFKIMLPQIKGMVTALAITSFIANWNEYMTPILYLPSYPTLASGLYAYQIEFSRKLNYPLLFSALFMTIIPCLILYFIFQEEFLHIDIGGGLKG